MVSVLTATESLLNSLRQWPENNIDILYKICFNIVTLLYLLLLLFISEHGQL